MQRRRRRNGHLRRLSGVRLQELEMLDHRMRLVAAELADDAQQHLLRLQAALERDLALADIGLDVVSSRDEVDLPGHAAVFAVGDRLQPGRLLLRDHAGDFAVFDRLESFGVDFACAPAARGPSFSAACAGDCRHGRRETVDLVRWVILVYFTIFPHPERGRRERSEAGGGPLLSFHVNAEATPAQPSPF